MTDLRTPDEIISGGVEPIAEDELVAADDTIIGRAFWWSLLIFTAVGGGIFAMTMAFRQPEAIALPEPAPFVPPRAIEVAATPPVVIFTDITEKAGIDFVHENGAEGEKLLPETMGGGCAFLDFDNDGDQDILLVNSTTWNDAADQLASSHPASTDAATTLATSPAGPTHALFANDGTGRFTNVTPGSGLDVSFYGMGCAVADYDADGLCDIFISALGPDHLYRNNGDGTFTDVTAAAGVAGAEDAWGTSAGFFDYDIDGHVDLFVCNYVKWSRAIDFAVNYTLTGIGRAYGPPTNFAGVDSYLYRNNGDGTFSDVSAAAGIQVRSVLGQPMGKALGLSIVDIDRDGWQDVLVANDTVGKFFFHNQGDGTFAERGADVGLAYDRSGNATGAMGVDAAQYRNDQSLGFVVGNFANEMSSLLVSQQGDPRQFADEAITEGIGAPTRLSLTFGAFFCDYDLDGRLDLLQANGHIEDDINVVQPSQRYAQAAQLFWNAGPEHAATFVEVEPELAGDLARPIVGRGAAYADIDGDGDLDVLLTQVNGPPMLLRNDQDQAGRAAATVAAASSPGEGEAAAASAMVGAADRAARGHHWLRVKLRDETSANRDALGARLELTAAGVTQYRTVSPTRSYLSQVELPVTFGLGDADRFDSVRIIWPDGTVQDAPGGEADRLIEISRGH